MTTCLKACLDFFVLGTISPSFLCLKGSDFNTFKSRLNK